MYPDVAIEVAEDVLQLVTLTLAYLVVVGSSPSCISDKGMNKMQGETQLCDIEPYTVAPEDSGVQVIALFFFLPRSSLLCFEKKPKSYPSTKS